MDLYNAHLLQIFENNILVEMQEISEKSSVNESNKPTMGCTITRC